MTIYSLDILLSQFLTSQLFDTRLTLIPPPYLNLSPSRGKHDAVFPLWPAFLGPIFLSPLLSVGWMLSRWVEDKHIVNRDALQLRLGPQGPGPRQIFIRINHPAKSRTLALKGKKTIGEHWKMHGMPVSHLPSRPCANTPATTTASSLTALNTAQQLAPMIICAILIYGLDLL